MTLARITISGSVYRAPEKRFTGNNVPITGFTLNIAEDEETLIRVVARGNLAEIVERTIQKGDSVVVEGRLQTASQTNENGVERRTIEVDANSVMKLNQSQVAATVSTNERYAQEEFKEELIGEDEIPF